MWVLFLSLMKERIDCKKLGLDFYISSGVGMFVLFFIILYKLWWWKKF